MFSLVGLTTLRDREVEMITYLTFVYLVGVLFTVLALLYVNNRLDLIDVVLGILWPLTIALTFILLSLDAIRGEFRK